MPEIAKGHLLAELRVSPVISVHCAAEALHPRFKSAAAFARYVMKFHEQ
jgi:hypothetical protein